MKLSNCVVSVVVVLLWASSVYSQLESTGSISWVHFDNITIQNPTSARTYTLWKMPIKAGWTGLIGLNTNSDESQGYNAQVTFTIGINEIPPSFASQSQVAANWNSVPASGSIQIPASGGTGDDEWYFLFQALADPNWLQPVTIGVYIIEMQEMKENQTSQPITLYNGQEFLFKIDAVGRDFQEGDLVDITLNRQCNTYTAIKVGEIPGMADQYKGVGTNLYLYGNGSSIFYVISLQEDCSLLTVTIGRIGTPVTEVSDGSVVTYYNYTWGDQDLLKTSEPYVGITIRASGLNSWEESIGMWSSSGNFYDTTAYTFQNVSGNQVEWQLWSSTLEPVYWFFRVYAQGDTLPVVHFTFSTNMNEIVFNEPQTVYRKMSPDVCAAQENQADGDSLPIVTYQMPQESSCTCIYTSWRNVQYVTSYPKPPMWSNSNPVLPPGLSNPFSSDPYAGLLCMTRMPTSNENMVITLSTPFSQSLLTTQDIIFEDVPIQSIDFGQNLIIPANTTSFYLHITNANNTIEEGGVVVISTTDGCATINVVQDDYGYTWTSYRSVLQWVSSQTSASVGWLILGQSKNVSCEISVNSLPTSTLAINYGDSSTAFVAFIPFNTTHSASLIHVYVAQNTSGVFLEFSSPIALAMTQARKIPILMKSFAVPPDNDNFIETDYTNISSFPILAISARSGGWSQDFYAIAIMPTTDIDLDLSVTASVITPTVHHYDSKATEIQLTVNPSSAPQIIEIPFSENLRVVSTEVKFSDSGCLNSLNMTECVYFGSNGFQTQPGSNTAEMEQGMHISPAQDYYYAGNTSSASYYFYVAANSPKVSLTIRTHTVQYLCDPVLLCNGHGVCPNDRSIEGCSCLSGTGFSFSDFYCTQKDLKLMGLYLIIAIFVFYATIKIVNCILLRKKTGNGKMGEKTPLNSDLRTESITSHLISANITLEDVELKVGNAQLLSNVNLHMKSGEITSVIGPSGAGKSTIMKVLSGRVKPTSGTIYINGDPVEALSPFRSLIGYVPQDDVMNPLLTVRENIIHSALMRLPADMPYNEKIRLVDAVIESLGLSAKRDVVVGDLGGQSSLSGGQRKRVSIGMELVICPSILLLDEPTSGLDSKTALNLILLLKNQVAPMGINIITVVHQPRFEILQASNNIMILAAGELKYFGRPTISELAESFPRLRDPSSINGANIADLLIDHIEELKWKGFVHQKTRKNTSSDIYNSVKDFRAEDDDIRIDDVHSNNNQSRKLKPRNLPNFGKQLLLLTKRALQQFFRDTRSLIILYALTIFSACLIGALYHKSEFIGPPSKETIAKCPPGFQFLCAQNQQDTYMVQALLICLALGLTAGSSSLNVFGGTEKLVYARECTSGQNNIAYYIAKMLSCIPNQVLAPLLFVSIFHVLTQPDVEFWKLFIVSFGIYDACMNIAILSSILLADSRALTVSVVSICICNVLSGFNPTLTQLHSSLGGFLGRALPALSYSRWAIEGFYLSVIEVFDNIYDISIALTMWNYAMSDHSLAFAMPFIIGLAMRLISAIAITQKARSK